MDLLAEIIADIILAVGIFLVQWCIRHKNITLTIFVITMIVIDVFVLMKYK